MTYQYRITSTGYSSARYGNCEVCGKPAGEVYLQIESVEYAPGRFTHYGCRDYFGHKECLLAVRRTARPDKNRKEIPS